jgi:hypothetical protein
VTDREEAAQNNKHLKRKIVKEKIKSLLEGWGGFNIVQNNPKQFDRMRMLAGHVDCLTETTSFYV